MNIKSYKQHLIKMMEEASCHKTLYNYKFVKKLGKGSYGEVWLTTYTDNKKYVVKKIRLKSAPLRERQAAHQECRLLSQLNHPNIVNFKDSFEDDGYLYIAMGFCEGGDLHMRLREQQGAALEERQIGEWLVQITMGLQYLHQRNILHRDLKTQNIFLTRTHLIKLGDLGISRVLNNSEDLATTVIGTPYYMSPELFSNKPYNHKSDIWALGCCTFEMASLKHAFNAQNFTSLSFKILAGRIPDIPPIYSPQLNSLVHQMMHQNPDMRPSVGHILRHSYIRNHIKNFLKITEAKSAKRVGTAVSHQRVNSGGSAGAGGDRSRPTSANINDHKHAPQPPRVIDIPTQLNNKNVPTGESRLPPAGPMPPAQIPSPIKEESGSAAPMKCTELELTILSKAPVTSANKPVEHLEHNQSAPNLNKDDQSSQGGRDQRSRQERLHSKARLRRRALRQMGGASPELKDEKDGPILARRKQSPVSSPLPELHRPISSHSRSVSDKGGGSAAASANDAINKHGLKKSSESSSAEDDVSKQKSTSDERELQTFIHKMNETLKSAKVNDKRHGNKPLPVLIKENNDNQSSGGGGGGDTDTEAGPTEQANETVNRTERFNCKMIQIRKDCMKGLGYEIVRDALAALNNIDGEEEHDVYLRRILSSQYDAFVGKIYMLKLWDDNQCRPANK